MRYRDRLIITMGGVVLLTGLLVVALNFWLARGLLIDAIRSQVLSIAATAARQVDVEQLQQVHTAADMDSEAYAAVEAQLRAIRDANRRDDVYLRYVYTGRPVPGDPSRWTYVVDAEERGTGNKSPVGEAGSNAVPFNVESRFTEFVTDE
ncbi:MAG: hypothetical protein KDA05_00800 [Phycisphaerales bacterium]|nr:hypothetical protein [Phycisphaerales bacterium]